MTTPGSTSGTTVCFPELTLATSVIRWAPSRFSITISVVLFAARDRVGVPIVARPRDLLGGVRRKVVENNLLVIATDAGGHEEAVFIDPGRRPHDGRLVRVFEHDPDLCGLRHPPAAGRHRAGEGQGA